jgi:hypothetical protein
VDKFAAGSDDPLYQVQSIPTTHIDMPKVVSNEDEGYRRLLGAIKQACNHVPSRVTPQPGDALPRTMDQIKQSSKR